MALLGLLVALVMSGWVADDEVAYAGPWAMWVSAEVSAWATHGHTHVGQVLILMWVGLHVLAVAYHQRVKREDLLTPMWCGDKAWLDHTDPDTGTDAEADVGVLTRTPPASLDGRTQRIKALVWFGLCVLAVVGLVSFGQVGG